MKIQLLHFEGCPNVDAARAAIRTALTAEKLDVAVEEIDIERADAPEWARGWGSPTILIDGKDVAGQERTAGSSCCRLYADGAPKVESIRSLISTSRGRSPNSGRVALPVVGALTAAVAASACCLVPAVVGMVGVSGAGFASKFAPFRIHFLIATGVALAIGFWFAYRPQKDCGCDAPKSRRNARIGLWISTVMTVGLAIYPMLGNGNTSAGSVDVEAKATLDLNVIGMDCKECTSSIANAIKKVPGVVSATVDFESGNAVVRYDGRDGMADAAIKAVEDAGYRAERKR